MKSVKTRVKILVSSWNLNMLYIWTPESSLLKMVYVALIVFLQVIAKELFNITVYGWKKFKINLDDFSVDIKKNYRILAVIMWQVLRMWRHISSRINPAIMHLSVLIKCFVNVIFSHYSNEPVSCIVFKPVL